MSRRFHLGINKKEQIEKIKDFNIEQFKENFTSDEYSIEISKLSKEVFCFGKVFNEDIIKNHASPAFKNKEVNEFINQDYVFYLITKEGMKEIIEDFRKQIANHFKELLNSEEDRFSYIYFRTNEWDNEFNIKPYDLDKGSQITNSSNLEYSIFELIRLYKAIDWDNEVVSISAW